MTEEELRKMIREALGRNTEGGEYRYEYPQVEERTSSAKQLPQGLLSVSQVDMPGTDGKQVMLQGDIPLPVGSVGLQGGMMPTFGQKMAGVSYNLPVGEGNLSVRGGVTTDPRMQGATKDVSATYSRKMLEDLYISAYINQMLGQGSRSPSVGVGIQGLF
jgi:hypothetical protein